jgi:class 3 adenylate cyclase
MKKLLNKVMYTGIDDSIDPSTVKCISLANIIAFLLILLPLSYVPLFIYYLPSTIKILYIFIVCAVLNAVVILLNYMKKHLLSVIFFASFSLIFLIISSMFLGRYTNFHLLIICSLYLIFFVFPKNMKHIMFLFIFLFILSYVGIEIWFTKYDRLINADPIFFDFMRYTQVFGLSFFVFVISYHAYHVVYVSEDQLKREQEKSERLLLNILPEEIANILKDDDKIIAEHLNNASILFADVVNFTPLSAKMTPIELVEMLNHVFTDFDALVEKYGLEKIKTIGDCYMVASGVPRPRDDHAQALTCMALDMRDTIAKKEFNGKKLNFRIGINSGPVVAGVIGRKKFIYDLWGDAVNTASRMESHSHKGVVQVSEATYKLIKDSFICEPKGAIDVKGKGKMDVWHVKNKIQFVTHL